MTTSFKRNILLFAFSLSFLTFVSVASTRATAKNSSSKLQAVLTSVSAGWQVGQTVGLQKGMIIRVGSGVQYPINACVPEDNWLVKVKGGPRTADGYIWWDVDCQAVDNLPTSGTGWVAHDITPVTCP